MNGWSYTVTTLILDAYNCVHDNILLTVNELKTKFSHYAIFVKYWGVYSTHKHREIQDWFRTSI